MKTNKALELARQRMAVAIKSVNREKIELFDKTEEFSHLPLKDIIVEEQVRKRIDTASESFQELVDSIKEKGVLLPIYVQKKGDQYLLLAGERRFRASEIAGILTIPARILSIERDLSKEEIIEIQLMENLQREALDPLDEAHGYFDFLSRVTNREKVEDILSLLISCERRPQKVNSEDAEAIRRMVRASGGKSPSTIRRYLSILKLPDKVQASVREGRIGVTQGAILYQKREHVLFDEAVRKAESGASRDELEALFKETEEKQELSPVQEIADAPLPTPDFFQAETDPGNESAPAVDGDGRAVEPRIETVDTIDSVPEPAVASLAKEPVAKAEPAEKKEKGLYVDRIRKLRIDLQKAKPKLEKKLLEEILKEVKLLAELLEG